MTITIAVIVLVALVAAAAAGLLARRTARRRSPERAHWTPRLRALTEAERERYAEQWRAVQTQFVLDPAGAVVAGDDLVTRLVGARGYPAEDHDDEARVEHAPIVDHYRDAHEIFLRGQRGQASTEELRVALVHYRQLIADLLDEAAPTTAEMTPADVRHDRS
jgi:hypothetical protein